MQVRDHHQATVGGPVVDPDCNAHSALGAPSGSSTENKRPVSSDAAEALRWLTPDLKTTLASLDGAPTAVATAVVQLLPFGSRAVLIDQGLAVGHTEGDPCAVMELTDLAYEVMHAAALAAAANPEAVVDWMQRARAAAAAAQR